MVSPVRELSELNKEPADGTSVEPAGRYGHELGEQHQQEHHDELRRHERDHPADDLVHRERIVCGKGLDLVFADKRDRVARDCEQIRRF
jgi:hypothetical protein